MSSGDKMAPFMASEMAWVCHVIFFIYVYIYKNYSTYFIIRRWNEWKLHKKVRLISSFNFFMISTPTRNCRETIISLKII